MVSALVVSHPDALFYSQTQIHCLKSSPTLNPKLNYPLKSSPGSSGVFKIRTSFFFFPWVTEVLNSCCSKLDRRYNKLIYIYIYIYIYIWMTLRITPVIDCQCVGAVPNIYLKYSIAQNPILAVWFLHRSEWSSCLGMATLKLKSEALSPKTSKAGETACQKKPTSYTLKPKA